MTIRSITNRVNPATKLAIFQVPRPAHVLRAGDAARRGAAALARGPGDPALGHHQAGLRAGHALPDIV